MMFLRLEMRGYPPVVKQRVRKLLKRKGIRGVWSNQRRAKAEEGQGTVGWETGLREEAERVGWRWEAGRAKIIRKNTTPSDSVSRIK